MALLNYTTTIPVEKTLAEIQQILVKHGARSIMVDYDPQGVPEALSFLVPTAFGDRGFRLPVNLAAVLRALQDHHRTTRSHTKAPDPAQAARVGWRILKDWIEAQMAIVELQLVTLDQVMLPYLQVDRTGRTLYDVMRERQLALPSPDDERAASATG